MTPVLAYTVGLTLYLLGMAGLVGLPLTGSILGAAAAWMMMGGEHG